MNVFAPEEIELRAETPADRSLTARARRIYTLAPDLGLFAAIAVINVLVFGPMAGNLWTPSRILQLPLLRAHPLSSYTPLDSFALALATIQLALVSVWVVFSQRTALVRGVLAFCVLTVFSVTLAVTHNTSWGLTGIGAVLGVFSVGVMAASVCLGAQGWRPVFYSLEQELKIEGKQFGLSELMILSAVVGVGCVVVGWFMNIAGRNPFDFFGFIFSQREFQLRLGSLGLLGFTSYWLLAGTNVGSRLQWFQLLMRIVLIAIGGTSILYAQVWLDHSIWFGFGGDFLFETVPGDSLFFLLHTLGLAAAFVAARRLGIGFERRPQENKFRWIAEASQSKVLRVIAVCCFVGGGIWGTTFVPGMWANYQLQLAVRPYGVIFNQNANTLGYTLYVRHPLDANAFEVLSERPSVSNLVIVSGDQVNEEVLKMLQQMTWLSSLTVYQSPLSPEQEQELLQALPTTAIRLFP